MSNGNGRLAVPGRVPVSPHWDMRFPTAQPVPAVISTQNGIDVLVLGGMSKLEEVATRVAPAIIAIRGLHRGAEAIAKEATTVAAAILAEAARATAEAMQPQPEQPR